MKRVPKTVGYIISDSKGTCFKDCEIMRTDRGWWKDVSKLWRIMDATLEKKNLAQARKAAGITKKQWRRFADIHPEFASARYSCKGILRRLENPNYFSTFELPSLDLSLSSPRIVLSKEDEEQEEMKRSVEETREMFKKHSSDQTQSPTPEQ